MLLEELDKYKAPGKIPIVEIYYDMDKEALLFLLEGQSADTLSMIAESVPDTAPEVKAFLSSVQKTMA